MDSEGQSPKSRFLEAVDDGSETLHKMLNSEAEEPQNVSGFESSVEAVGSPPTASEPVRDETTVVEAEISSHSSQSPPSSTTGVKSTSPVVQKGTGLRKWRRVRRDLIKDASNSADSAQILKRRYNNTESSKIHGESKLKSMSGAEVEESVESMESVESRNDEINPNVVVTGTLDPELELLASSGFSIGMDSDNSEDHSCKSSTAASAPRQKYEALRSGRERGRVKNLGGKGSTSFGPQKVQHVGGGMVDSSKKIRDDMSRFEKENSLSSVESDLRSSVVGILQWGNVIDRNGKHPGRSAKFDEHSDEDHTGGEVRSGYYKNNMKNENLFSDDLDGKLEEEDDQKSEKQSSSYLDPFMKSAILLQEAQEALEKEIEKIGAIGTEQVGDPKLFEEMEARSSLTLEADIIYLKNKVENLELKLEESSATIKAKEQKLCKLEAVLGGNSPPDIECSSTRLSSLQHNEEVLNSELEVLIKKKMEADIEYFLIARMTGNLKTLSEDQIRLFHEQKHLARDHEQTMLKLRDAEERMTELSERTEKLDEYCRELVGMESVLRLQNKLFRFSLSFVVQLMLLLLALGLFLMHLLSRADGVAPT
ncbi:WPP domain-interacting protein 1 [Platanthera guangdongensis]|uniref:WPP domain-interacting protein 1 n=1 Tax=Platanthera guangdongensis TaxID=2320717 RepID=A0ABR2N0W1_9ASPA